MTSLGYSLIATSIAALTMTAFPGNWTESTTSGSGRAVEDVVSFDRQISPLLTKLGCNAGACHGAAEGRGSFRLSLLGSDPAGDHRAITRDFLGRRVNLVDPTASLLLRKPWGELEHGGGLILDPQSPESKRLLQWVAAGAPRGVPAQVLDLKLMPSQTLFHELPGTCVLRVTAHLAGETAPRDVTEDVLFTTPDPSAIRIDAEQQVHLLRPGQHLVLARYLNQVVALPLLAPWSTREVDLDWASAVHFVDTHVFEKWQAMRITPSPLADDSTWLRRVHLDLTGQLPSIETSLQFLSDPDPQKQSKLVDQLLASPAFTDYWTWKFAGWLNMRSLPHERPAFLRYRDWLRDQLANDTGCDVLLRQLLTTDGDSYVEGAANFSRLVADARSHAELVGQVFAGIRLGCANCHDHPLDRWTQEDYHGFAAIFAKVQRGRHVGLASRGEVTNLRTLLPALPRIPGQGDLAHGEDHRPEVVAWLLDDQHDYLAQVMVNRMWQAMFGRGLVDPVDDRRSTNPATHPELLNELARDFADHGYRIRHTLRVLALSQTYARSATVLADNQADDRFYSRAYPRPLEPALLVDAIAQVTGVREVFDTHNTDLAVQVIDLALPAATLDQLGRPCTSPSCGRSAPGPAGLSAQLHLLNGDVINRKISDPQGRLAQLLAEDVPVGAIVSQYYLRAFCRFPSAEELSHWNQALTADDPLQQRERLEDFVWSLLNSRTFTHR